MSRASNDNLTIESYVPPLTVFQISKIMEVLNTCQVLWKFGGVCLPASATTKDIYIGLLANVIILSHTATFSAMNLFYIITGMDIIDVSKLIFAIFQFMVFLNIFGSYLSVVLVKRKIGQMVDSLQQLVNLSEHLNVVYHSNSNRIELKLKMKCLLFVWFAGLKIHRVRTMYVDAERRAHIFTTYVVFTNMIFYCVAFTIIAIVASIRYFFYGVIFDVTQWYCIKYVFLSTTTTIIPTFAFTSIRIMNNFTIIEFWFCFVELHTIRQRLPDTWLTTFKAWHRTFRFLWHFFAL